jgi:hypothetical protein
MDINLERLRRAVVPILEVACGRSARCGAHRWRLFLPAAEGFAGGGDVARSVFRRAPVGAPLAISTAGAS